MEKTALIIIFSALLLFIFAPPISGLDGGSIINLKEAGVSDQTIELMIKEKVVETAAFSVQEVLDMKKAGLSAKTIQMIIREGSFLKDIAPIVYGKDVRSIQFATVQDILELKRAGVSDEVIQAIIYVVGDSTDSERQEALDLLKGMGIRIDLRGGE